MGLLSRIDDSFTIQVFAAMVGKHYSILFVDYYVDDIYSIILFRRVMGEITTLFFLGFLVFNPQVSLTYNVTIHFNYFFFQLNNI